MFQYNSDYFTKTCTLQQNDPPDTLSLTHRDDQVPFPILKTHIHAQPFRFINQLPHNRENFCNSDITLLPEVTAAPEVNHASKMVSS